MQTLKEDFSAELSLIKEYENIIKDIKYELNNNKIISLEKYQYFEYKIGLRDKQDFKDNVMMNNLCLENLLKTLSSAFKNGFKLIIEYIKKLYNYVISLRQKILFPTPSEIDKAIDKYEKTYKELSLASETKKFSIDDQPRTVKINQFKTATDCAMNLIKSYIKICYRFEVLNLIVEDYTSDFKSNLITNDYFKNKIDQAIKKIDGLVSNSTVPSGINKVNSASTYLFSNYSSNAKVIIDKVNDYTTKFLNISNVDTIVDIKATNVYKTTDDLSSSLLNIFMSYIPNLKVINKASFNISQKGSFKMIPSSKVNYVNEEYIIRALRTMSHSTFCSYGVYSTLLRTIELNLKNLMTKIDSAINVEDPAQYDRLKLIKNNLILILNIIQSILESFAEIYYNTTTVISSISLLP